MSLEHSNVARGGTQRGRNGAREASREGGGGGVSRCDGCDGDRVVVCDGGCECCGGSGVVDVDVGVCVVGDCALRQRSCNSVTITAQDDEEMSRNVPAAWINIAKISGCAC